MYFPNSRYGWVAIGIYLVAIVAVIFFSEWWFDVFPCSGEFCSWMPFVWVSLFWSVVFQEVLDITGNDFMSTIGFFLNLVTVYWIGKGIQFLIHRNIK